MLPVITAVTYGGRTRQLAWAEETVQLKDYGDARQLTLFEHGKVALQILTSDSSACPAAILAWLKSRWREENFLKYASENYGIDKICDYLATISENTKIVDNPARKKANAAVHEAEKTLAAAERTGRAARRPRRHPCRQEPPASPPCKGKSPGRAPPPRSQPPPATASPPNCPPAPSTQTRRPRCCAPGAAACKWSCDCSRTTPSTGYRTTSTPTCATTTNTAPSHAKPLIRGLAGTITSTPAAITVTLQAARRTPHHPRPGPAPRRNQRHPARHSRRHPPHHLPARAASRHLTPSAQPPPEIWAYSRWYAADVAKHPSASEAKPTIMSRLRHHPTPEETEPVTAQQRPS